MGRKTADDNGVGRTGQAPRESTEQTADRTMMCQRADHHAVLDTGQTLTSSNFPPRWAHSRSTQGVRDQTPALHGKLHAGVPSFEGGFDESVEQRMRDEWFGFEFRMELHGQEPRVIWQLDDFRQ